MSNPIPVITIDGPSGSGKGTVGARLARTLGWYFLDSGALYRCVALRAIEQGLTGIEADKLSNIANSIEVHFSTDVLLDGVSVREAIRSEPCGEVASRLAALPEVREALLQKQRDFVQKPGLVADGRDMGTVVFPKAIAKFYLSSTAEERARRRYLQLMAMGQNVNLDEILGSIMARDARDSGRAYAPLRPAEDAVVIDTTALGVEEVLDKIMQLIKPILYKETT